MRLKDTVLEVYRPVKGAKNMLRGSKENPMIPGKIPEETGMTGTVSSRAVSHMPQ